MCYTARVLMCKYGQNIRQDWSTYCKVNHEVWQAKFGSTKLYNVLRVTSCHMYTTYVGFFIATNSVETLTVVQYICILSFYNTGYISTALAAVPHHTHVTCFWCFWCAYLYTKSCYWKNTITTTSLKVTIHFVDFTHETQHWRCRVHSESTL